MLQSLQNISHANNVGYYKLKHLLQTNEGIASKKITVNIRGTGLTDLNLRYVKGSYSKNGMSMQKAIAMNSLIASLHAQQQNVLRNHIQKMVSGEQGDVQDKVSLLKAMSTSSDTSYSQSVLSKESLKGIVIDTKQ